MSVEDIKKRSDKFRENIHLMGIIYTNKLKRKNGKIKIWDKGIEKTNP